MNGDPIAEEPFSWSISESGTYDLDGGFLGTEYHINGPDGLICSVRTQRLAEDIASLPILQRELDRLRLVPVRRSEDDRLESVCQLLEELLAEVKRGNAVERTGAVSSVQSRGLATTKDIGHARVTRDLISKRRG
jgi:hypothetical protein